MSRIDELVAALCPDGVEYRKILSVTNVLYGAPFASELFGDVDGMPLIRIRDILRGSTNTRYSGDFDSEYVIHKGDILVGMDGDFNVGKWRDADALLNQRVLKIESKDLETLDNTFLYHLLGPLLKRVNDSILASTVKHLTARIIDTIEIPVPPIEVQREIVRILDAFTELTDTMTEELEARKAQYAYYRDRLLSLESLEALDGKPVEMVRLGDVGTFTRGSGIQKKDFVANGKPCIHYGQIYTKFGLFTDSVLSKIPEEQYAKSKKANPGDVIFAITSENIEDVCTPLVWEGDQPVAISGHSCAYTAESIVPRYLAYVATGQNFQMAKRKVAKGTKVIEVAPVDLARVEIPVPSLATQQKVVDILDRFDALTTSLTDGIPAEIEARRTQYAYYRDRLLDFPRKEVAAS